MDATTVLITLFTATLGAVGFSILFYMKPKRLPWAALAGLLTCAVYLAAKRWIGGELIPNLLAALVGAVFAEITARVTRAPVTVYLVPGIVPLVPGGALYETMSHLVTGEYGAAASYGLVTLKVAAGIAGGIIAVSVLDLLWRHFFGGRAPKTP